jgi:2-succinyl-6-hydroxy-2,4-cyclohexadiene-1-carboxylate synthase
MAPAIVLLHGFTHTGGSWAPVRTALPRGYLALAPDIRGHGEAGGRRPVDLDAVLGDLRATAPERFVLGGYSMGGRIALHAALADGLRERIEHLVLIGASPGLADPAERAERRAADESLATELEGLTIEEFADRWAATPVLADQAPGVAALARAERLCNSPAGLAAALRGLGTGALEPLWDRLGELRVPVTLIVGERDAKFRAIATAMRRSLPQARLEVIPGAGHAVHLEAPARVATILSRDTSQ